MKYSLKRPVTAKARIFICGLFCVVIVFGLIEIRHIYLVSEFNKDRIRLQTYLEYNDRFTNAYLSFFPDPPTVIFLAYGLPLNVKTNLEYIVNTNFSPLRIDIRYVDSP